MKLDTTLAMGSLDRVGDLARRAEQMGFAGIFTVEARSSSAPRSPWRSRDRRWSTP
jgi:alkanesulfonate monooxygenase SsuD/methylene tetrahydromethanopterin reductase-like flavin-dependent oxidoreductase (luciferase family)